MPVNNSIYISKENLEKALKRCYTIENVRVLNPSNNQTRYELIDSENKGFKVDVYYKNNNTVNIVCIGSEDQIAKGNELKELVQNSANYTDSVVANFCENITIDNHAELVKYLGEQESVTLMSSVNMGSNGIVNKYTTDFGDKATITFYPSTGKLRFQGLMMDLYIATRTFVLPLSTSSTKVIVKKDLKELNIENKVKNCIAKRIPNYYNATNHVMKAFIEDSLTLEQTCINLSDYSPWTFSILKVLEFRIKEILLNNRYIINDKHGFKIGGKQIFIKDNTTKKHVVDTNVIQVGSKDQLWLEKCYKYYNKNRHGLFHTRQQGFLSTTIGNDAEAKNIIVNVCDLLEKSYNDLSK